MNEAELNALYEILEVPPGTPFPELRRAYLHLRKLYGEGSLALDALVDEDGRREEILREIEAAYETLARHLGEGPLREEPSREIPPELRARIDRIERFSGPDLRMVREALGISLDQVARITRIGREYLKDIEEENFGALPPPVFLRGYLSCYAACLRLDGARVARDIMARYEARRAGGD